jgi:class 3 adenylate cyclase
MKDTQVPPRYRDVLDEQSSLYDKKRSIQVVNNIPSTPDIPIENPLHWLRIPDIVCVFVDMANSTKLSAEHHDNGTAGVYQFHTGTAVRLFARFDAPYIDVRGDGVLALFNSSQPHRALAAAVTFKTFSEEEIVPRVRKKTGVDIGTHIGIDQTTVLVRKIGYKRHSGRTDRQNEVWAGRPANIAAKLASLSKPGELLASDRFFRNFRDAHVLLSCGCPDGDKVSLWTGVDVQADARFDFGAAYALKTRWCEKHGSEFCDIILGLDEDT